MVMERNELDGDVQLVHFNTDAIAAGGKVQHPESSKSKLVDDELTFDTLEDGVARECWGAKHVDVYYL